LAVHKDHGQTVAIAAFYFTAFASGVPVARIFGGPVVDRLGRVRTIRATTDLGVVGVILFITAGNRRIVLVGVLAWAIGVSMGFPLGTSAAAESGADSAARVSVVASTGTSPTSPDRPPSAPSPSESACWMRSGSSSRSSLRRSRPPGHFVQCSRRRTRRGVVPVSPS